MVSQSSSHLFLKVLEYQLQKQMIRNFIFNLICFLNKQNDFFRKNNNLKAVYKNNRVYLPKLYEMCKLLSPNNTCKYGRNLVNYLTY